MSFPSQIKLKGFTILEFMVTITIGLVILTTVSLGQSKYNEASSLKGTVNDISIALRQAQIYGISVKEFTPGSNDFAASYGLSLNIVYPSAYVYFADRGTKDGIYTGAFGTCAAGGGTECIEVVPIPRGNTITSICTIPLSGADVCNVGQTHITFVRPATEAKIVSYNTTGGLIAPGYKGVKINFRSPSNSTRYITVYTTGQISVQ